MRQRAIGNHVLFKHTILEGHLYNTSQKAQTLNNRQFILEIIKVKTNWLADLVIGPFLHN